MSHTSRSRSFWPAFFVLSSAALCAFAPATTLNANAQEKTTPSGMSPIVPQNPAAPVDAGKGGENLFDYTAPNGGAPADLAKLVGIDQNLDAPVPQDLEFKDETGKTVKLGDYFGNKKPVLFTMLQLTCDLGCSAQFSAMTGSFKDPAFNFTPGQEFEVVTVSIDPKESPMIAQDVHDEQIKALGNPAAAKGWHFLTGDEKNTKALAKALGIKYMWDEGSKQYIHPDGIVMATPEGHISRYFMRLDYNPRDMRYSIIEASKDKIGTFIDQIALSCFHYNPSTGKYTLQIMMLLRLVGGAFVLGSVAAIAFAVMREKRVPRVDSGSNNKKVKTA